MSFSAYAIVPARGGSKAIKGKNLRLLGGHPLVAWAIIAARMCPEISRVIVSTDSPQIASVARSYGGEVPFMRPAELARDDSVDREFVIHALDWLRENEDAMPDCLVHLRPTSPLRDPDLIGEAIRLISANSTATALRSVNPAEESPYKMLRLVDGYLTGLFSDDPRPEYYNLPRQSFPAAFQPNGYVDVIRTSFVTSNESLHGGHALPYFTPACGDIDRPEDFEAIERSLREGNNPVYLSLEETFSSLKA